MKRISALSFAFLLAFTLSACGGEPVGSGEDNTSVTTAATEPDTATESPAASEEAVPVPDTVSEAAESPVTSEEAAPEPDGLPEGKAVTALIKWMMDGTFSFDFNMITEIGGEKMMSSGTMAVSGEKLSMETEAVFEGEPTKTRIVMKDGNLYMADYINQFIMEMPVEAEQDVIGVMSDFSGITLIGYGEAEVYGRTLPYEDYKDETGEAVRFYIDGDLVYAIETGTEDGKNVMIIENASNTVPPGAFDLPEGFMNMSDFDIPDFNAYG